MWSAAPNLLSSHSFEASDSRTALILCHCLHDNISSLTAQCHLEQKTEDFSFIISTISASGPDSQKFCCLWSLMINSPSLYLIVRAYLCYQLKIKVVLAHSNSAGFRCFIFFFFHEIGFKCQFEFSRRTKCFVLFFWWGQMSCTVFFFYFFYYVFRGTTNILVTVFTYRYQAVKLAVLDTLTPICILQLQLMSEWCHDLVQ